MSSVPPDSEGTTPDPRSRLMNEVAAQMDAIEADLGSDFQIGRVITMAEVIDSDGNVNLRVRHGQLPWVTLGMLDWARKVLELELFGRPPGRE